MDEVFRSCAEAIDQADGLLITAGAGMGVDSGLPDFRGQEGFWQAYPALRQAGIEFSSIASPDTFGHDPRLAWGFYGHRLKLYRETQPHAGFAKLRDFASFMEHGIFVFTSNVDGQFQKAGYSEYEVCECHGSIHHLQCHAGCSNDIWSAEGFEPEVDEQSCRLLNELPACPHCGTVARPTILMFGDWKWNQRRVEVQKARLDEWLATVRRLVIIEVGAGTAIPSVRHFSEFQEGFLIRINPTDALLPEGKRGISLPMGGLQGLSRIQAALASMV